MKIQDILNAFEKNPKNKIFRLSIRLLPRSSVNKIMEIKQAAPDQFELKIKLTAVPIDGQANEALIEFLHKQLKLPRYCFKLEAGQKSKNKIVSITKPA